MNIKNILLLAAIVLLVPGFVCTDKPEWADDEVIHAQDLEYKLDTVVTGLAFPWGMVFLPDGRMLISERSGLLKVFDNGALLEDPVGGLPEIYVRGQGGLMDLELHPDYVNNGWIYITYASPDKTGKEDGGNTTLMRARLSGNQLIDQEVLFKAKPNTTKGVHFGSRIEFDREGYLYFSVGDRGQRERAQSLSTYNGKVYRLKDDGSVPDDNPFVNQSGAVDAVFSYGHRNPQGLALNPDTGELWETEHGPKGGDEVNIIRKGNNYGWPEITYGINYNGTTITDDTAKAGMEQPVIFWRPSIAPCGMTFVSGDRYPQWKGDLLVGSLKFQYLERCDVEGNKIVSQEKLLEGIGRVRNVRQGPDGYIYVAVEGRGMIVKIVPVNT